MPLYRERFVVAVAPGHPFERLNAVSVKDLSEQNYLARANCEYRDICVTSVKGRRPRVQAALHQRARRWIQCMVLAGLGFTYLPEFAVTVPGLVIRPLVEPEVYRTVSIVTVRGRPHSPAVGAFVREAKRHRWDGGCTPSSDARELLAAAS